MLQMSKPSIGCGGFSWLEAYEPVTLAGKSIRLYWIPNFGETRPPSRSVGVFHSPLATGGQDAYSRDHSGAFELLSFKPEPYTERPVTKLIYASHISIASLACVSRGSTVLRPSEASRDLLSALGSFDLDVYRCI